MILNESICILFKELAENNWVPCPILEAVLEEDTDGVLTMNYLSWLKIYSYVTGCPSFVNKKNLNKFVKNGIILPTNTKIDIEKWRENSKNFDLSNCPIINITKRDWTAGSQFILDDIA